MISLNVATGVRAVGALFLLLCISPAEVSALDCSKATTQREIEECTKGELETASRELDVAYNGYSASLSKEQQSLLGKAQEAWQRYRDANCEASAAVYSGGTMAPAELVGCKLRLTKERLAELKRIYEEPPFPASQ